MWTKTTDLVQQGEKNAETWIRRHEEKVDVYDMDIYLGKKTDLLKLKKGIISSLDEKINYYRSTREKLYNKDEYEYVDKCPITGISTEETQEIANIYGAQYVQTPDTGHVYVKNRPTKKSIHDFYLNDVTYAATYTDKSGAENRLNAIAVPWLEWTKKVYYNQYGKYPKKILDVGSGAGHFVEACRRDGIHAEGIELSESSQKFAKDIWGITLDGRNYLDVYQEYAGYDIVTFWGLLEHTPNPSAIMDATYEMINKNGGMVISKLPRWHSLSSAAQRLSPLTILRHIDPMGHIMLFSDASAAELYHRTKFSPVAAWYYGMDIYETFMQSANKIKDYKILNETGQFQQDLQQFVDEQRFSDGLTLVGVPM